MSRSVPLPRTDTIVHIGAAPCRELEGYLSSGASRIVLVEAEPDQLAYLSERVNGESRVTLVHAAVAAREAAGTLNVFNNPELTSLRAPSGILKLYPGLKIENQIAVTSVGVNDLLADLDVDDNAALVIDAAGEELSILEALAGSGGLRRFRAVHTHCGAFALYADARDASSVTSLFNQPGWSVARSALPGEPDRLVVAADFSRSRHDLAAAKATIGQLEGKLKAAEESAREAEQATEKLSGDLERLTAEIGAERDAAKALRAEREQREAETRALKAEIETLATARDELETRLAQEKEEHTAAARTYSKEIETLTLQGTEHEFRRAGLEREITRLAAQLELIKELMLRGEEL